ncbi:MAG: ATP synthase F0 subunit B [Clostridia bacterium]|nr:ATP synthase F0 subunit B [Clostridia bacterium]
MEIPLNIDWQQILLHVFNFIILTGGLYFLLYSPIKKFIDSREQYYKDLDSQANAKLETAEKLEQEAKAKIANTDNEIKENRTKAEAELDAYIERQKAEANAKAEKILSDARDRAQAEKRSVMESAEKEIIDITKAVAAKMLSSSTDEAYSQFLDIVERDERNDNS